MKKILLGLALAGLGVSAESNAQSVMAQNFESATMPAIPTGWANTHTGGTGTGWITSAGPLTWTNIATVGNHTKFAVVDDWNDSTSTPSYLSSPVFSLVGAIAPKLGFDFFYIQAFYNLATPVKEMAWVEISTNGGTSYAFLDSIRGSYSSTASAYVWGTKFVDLNTYVGQANVKVRFGYTDNGRRLTGLAIDNIEAFSPQANDIALMNVTPQAGSLNSYAGVGTSVTFGGTVLNRSTATITSFDAVYKVGSGTAVTTPITGVSIAPFTTANFTCTAYSVPSSGTKATTMWVNAAGDPNHSNDTMKTTIFGISNFPKKKPVMEEATGTWCGWCIRGIVYMDSLETLHGDDVSLIAVHNGDPMVVSVYDTWIGGFISGYPKVFADRTRVDDPGNLIPIYNSLSTYFGFADIAYQHSISGTSLTLNVKVRPAVDLSGDYRLVLVHTEDDMHGTATGWAQKNYYSGYSTVMIGAGINYNTQPSTIPATNMYYDHVARSINPSTSGTAGVLPATMTNGTTYTATMTATIPAGTDTAKSHYIVMLVNNANGSVLNSQNKDGVLSAVGVEQMASGVNALSIYPNPAAQAANVEFSLETAGSVTVNVIDMNGRSLYSTITNMNSGTQKIAIPVSGFAAGLYNVIIGTDKGTVTEKLSVIK